jgi:hypothetical protein
MGVSPDVSLKEARDRRYEARKLLTQGVDPGESRKAMKAGRTARANNRFEVIAR